jgi:hypothetical protein
MFFGDPVAAFANVGRALRSGARLAFVCPQAMALQDWYLVPLTALARHASTPDHQPGASAMFSLADPAHVTDVLRRAGFTDVNLATYAAPTNFGPDVAAAAEFYVGSGPARALLEGSDLLTAERAREILVAALEPYAGPRGVQLPGVNWLVTATRP